MLTENIYLQAETATITTREGATRSLTQTGDLDEGDKGGGNKDVFNLRPGYSGEGYLDFGSSTSGAEAAAYTLTIPAGEGGTYALHVRYSSSSSRSVRIDDGTSQQDVTFAPTADGEEDPFDNWSVEVVEVELVGGENTLVLSLFGGNGPNIDALAITNPGETADFAPRFTTLAAFEIAEGETAVGIVGAADVDEDTTDGDDGVDPVTFSIADGADGDAFTIDSTTGELALKTPADPESQPSYEVVVAATDAAGNTVTQTVAVSVTEVVPAFTAAYFEAEDGVPGEGNDTGTQIRDAGNPEDNGNRPDFSGTGYVDYGNVAGDSHSYTFDDSEGGARILYVRYATNGDRPLDVLVNGTSILAEPVEATPFTNTDPDGSGPEEGFDHWEIAAFDITTTAGSNTITLSIPSPGQNAPNVDALAIARPGEPVNFFAPEISSAAAFTLDENTTEAGQVVAKDLDGDALSYALSGDDADKVSIDAEGRLTLDAAPDFEAPQDADGNNAYEVTVAVSDGVETVSQDLTISVADVDPELGAPTIDPIVLQGETGIIPAGADTFHRDQADIAAAVAAGDQAILDAEREGAPNTNKGGNPDEPLDGFGLREGYSGFGYTDFGGDGAAGNETVSWTVEVTEAGLYDLHIRFASAAATAGDRPVDVLVNGAVQHGELGFPNRDGFATWVVREPVQVALEAGPNTLSLAIPAGFSNGPNIDAVALTTIGDTPAFPPANTAPSFDGATAAITVDEGTEGVLETFAVTDAEDDAIAYTLSGPDAAAFTISAAGELSFAAIPDAGAPADADGDNLYEVTVIASDGVLPVSRDVAVTVTDTADDGPVPVTFDAAEITGWGGQDRPDQGNGMTVGEAGASLTLDGNLWKRVPLPEAYDITETSTLLVTIAIGEVVPEIVGIGFDDDENPFENEKTVYQLAGTQTQSNFRDLRGQGTDNDDGTITFAIDLSAQAGTSPSSMVFVADDDASWNGFGSVTFSAVSLVEQPDGTGNLPPEEVGGGAADITVLEGSSLEVDLPFVDADGDALSYGVEITDAEGSPVTVEGLAIVDGVLAGPAPALPGTYTVTLTADDDGEGGHAPVQSVFTLTVSNANEAPEAADAALEPYLFEAGEPIPGIDLAEFAPYFSDPDGDPLELTAEDLPAGLTLNEEGVIEGTPSAGGDFSVTIRATDPSGASATLTLDLQIAGGGIGDVVTVEAEDFTGLAAAEGFYATGQAGASDDQIIRVGSAGSQGLITTELGRNGLVEGWYRVAMTRYDETDGSATYSLRIGDTVLASGAAFDGLPDAETASDRFDNSAARGNAGQSGNLKTIVYDVPVYIDAGTVLTLSGISDAEALRTDKFTFTRIEAPERLSLAAAPVTENAEGAVIGTLSAAGASGPVTFGVDAASPFEIVEGNVLKLKDGQSLNHEEAETVSVAVTVDDGSGPVSEVVFFEVADVNEAPVLAANAALADVTVESGAGALIDLAPLGATDEDAGDTPGYAIASATGTPLPEGFLVDATGHLVVPADAPLGSYGIAVFATDGELDSDSVLLTVTVGEPAPFAGIAVQGEEAAITLSAAPDGDATVTFHRDQDDDSEDEDAGPDKILENGLRAGFSGNGYIDFGDDPGDTATFTFDVPEAGQYDVSIRYSSQDAGGGPRVLDLAVNGAPAVTTTFPSTDTDAPGAEGNGFNNWDFLTRTVTLDSGPNTISLALAAGTDAGPNVDRIEITAAGSGPIGAADLSADEDDNLAAAGEAATVAPGELSATEFRLTGVDSDIVTIEVSTDGGATYSAASPVLDGTDRIVTVDLSAFSGDDSVTVTFRLTDEAGNTVETASSVAIGDAPVTVDPIVIQAEDETQAAVTDVGGTAQGEVTREVNPGAVDDYGNYRPGAVGDAYIDFGTNPGDAITFTVTAPIAGLYTVTFRYANGDGAQADRPLALSVNGGTAETVSFPYTTPAAGGEAWETWSEVTMQLSLAAGDNAVELAIPPGAANGPNIDQATFTYADPATDLSADADGNLLLDGPTGALNETQAASINFNVSGRDADIVKTEISFDGGASRIDVTDIVDADGDFVIDGSGLAEGAQTATIIVTDAAGNEAVATHNLIVGDLPEGEAQTFEEVVRINFEAPTIGNGGFDAPAGYTTPEGFESDTGAAFDDRGNGFSYGWVDVDDATGAVTGTPARQPTGSPRYKNAASEASDLQKTYIHFDYPGAPDGDRERAWEIALENGTYEVTVAIGDTAGQYDSTYLLNAEGQPFGPSWEPVNLDGQKLTGGAYDASYDGEGLRSYLYTGIVEVTDGRLTLDGTDGQNVEIQWLDIERVPDLTPDDGRPADLDYSKFVDAVAASTQNGQVSIEIGDNGSLPIDIDPTSSLVVGVQLQAADHRGPAVSSVDDIRLYETLTGIEVPINVQITGGADSLTIRPLEGLKEFTSYTLDIEDVLDLGNLNDSSLPQRQFQDYSTSFVTGEAPEVEAREVAFVDSVVIDGFADGAAAFTSIEFGPDGKLYVSTIMGEIHRWDVNPDGSLDKGSQETLSLDHFQAGGRSIIGITFDPEDPNTIWVTDNAPVPRDGKAADTPDFSGQVSKITLGANGAFEGATAETYITGLPRSGGDHVTNSLEFRANPDAGQPGEPNYLLYLTQGSNSAAGNPDNAWGFRPERLLNASVLEVDPRRDAPDGGFDVQTEPYDPATNAPTYRTGGSFNDDGTFDSYYNPFAADAVLKIYGEGIRNAYDLVWHSNGFLYTPTNGTAAGGITPDDPTTTLDERVTNMPKQYDYLFQVQDGGFYGHPNPLLDHYVLNGGNPTSGDDPNSANTGSGGNGGYPFLVDPDPDYDLEGAFSLGFNKSPNGAIEYKGDLFGANLDGAILFAQFSVGDNVRVINVDPVTGRVTGDDVLRRPGGDVIDEYIDPLDIIENPATGQLYLMTLNRGTGESKIVLLNPAPGGVVSDTTADAGGDLGLVVVDASDPANVLFQVVGLDDDIQTVAVSFDGAQAESVSLTGGQFTADLTGRTGEVTATLTVGDDDGNSASTSTSFTPGEDVGAGTITIDALAFDVIDGDDGTILRRIDDPSTYEEGDSNDANGDGLNDNYDGGGYLDPNGGAEDKAAFTYVAAAAGTYVFTFRMANGDGSGAARPISIRAGDQSVAIDDTQTGSFTSWQDFPVTLTLEAGVNTIVIAQTSAAGGPNIDSVTVTPDEIADVTADEGGNLLLTIVDASDPAAVSVAISGADSDLTSLVVTFSDGTESVISTPSGNGPFEVDLSALAGDVAATLVVQDASSNTADVATGFTLGEAPVGNDGMETVNTVTYAIYEAENAELVGGPLVVSDTADERGQRGGGFVDFDGTGDQSITWTVSVPAAGTYGIDILYALAGTKAPRPATLSVNGAEQGTLAFAPNSNDAESVWGPQSAQVELNAGTNTITMTVPEANGANIDYLRITQAPLDDLTADEGGDLALSVVDASDPNAVVFEVAGLDADIVGLTVSFDGAAPQTVTLDGDDRFTADIGTYGEVRATLTVFDGATNQASAATDVVLALPNGNPDADIEIQSLDPAFYDDRLHFSWIDDNSASNPDRDYKESAVVEITNSGSEVLEFADATLSGPFVLASPGLFDGLTLAAGESIQVEVLFDRAAYSAGGNGQTGIFEGALELLTNDAEDPVATVDLAGFWQARDEGGWEPNINEVWKIFGFGNEIEGLSLQGGGQDDELDFYDVYLPADETEVLSSYWQLADGVTEARFTQLAAYHGGGGATLGIHAPGEKNADVIFSNHAGDNNQSILPVKGNGDFATALFTNATIPDSWAGNDIFGFEVANQSTDPTLNPTGSEVPSQAELDARYPGYTVDGNGDVYDPEGNYVSDGYTVRMFQAVDGAGAVIENVFLGVMDYTGINYDYNDNMFLVEGIAPVFGGGVATIAGLDEAAADDRLVFSRIDNPANGSQSFRDTATFTITNDGIGTLDVSDISVDGPFEISGLSAGDSIATGGSVEVTVTFTGTDPSDDNQAVLHAGSLTLATSAGDRTIALSGLAQIQSEGGEEPSVAQIVEALGYSTDVAQGQLANGGRVETVGDEVLLPYLQRLDGSRPVEVIQVAAYLSAGIGRLNIHDVSDGDLTELYAQDDNQYQTLLPDGLISGPGAADGVARASLDRDTPFGLKVTVDGRPTYSAWTDPDANLADDTYDLSASNEGHYIRFFQAKDAAGNDIEGTFIGIQDYPGGENFDYNDHMFVIKNVQGYTLSDAEDANGDGINDALVLDDDGDGTPNFFDGDFTPPPSDEQAPFNATGTPWAIGDGLTLLADQFDSGGQGVAWNDDPGKDGGSGRPDSDVEIVGSSDIGYVRPGEWVEYTLDAPAAGTYEITLDAKTPVAGAAIAVSVEDGPVLGTIAVPDSNGSSTDFGGTSFGPTGTISVSLDAGVNVLRLTFTGSELATNGYLLDLRSLTIVPGEAAENTPPTNSGIDGAPEGAADAAYSFDVSGFFDDAEDDALDFAATGLPDGLAISGDGVISGTPTATGDFAVTVTATDDDGATISSSFTLTVASEPVETGQAPFPGPDAPAFADGVLTVDASNYDEGGQGVAYNDQPGLQGGTTNGRPGSDVEQTSAGDIGWIETGEWLEYTIEVPADGLYDLDLLLATNGGGGRSATADFYLPGADTPYATSGSLTNPDTGSWTNFQPRSADGLALQAGTQIVRVTFAGGSQDFRSFVLTQQEATDDNVAPEAGTLVDAAIAETDDVLIDISAAFSDADGDPLSFTASGLPEGVSISSAGLISGIAPEVAADTDYTVTVTATDPEGLSDSSTFTLTVEDAANTPPTTSGIGGAPAGEENAAYSYDVSGFFEDAEDEALDFTASGLPAGLSISAAGVISGTPGTSGTFDVTVTATDDEGAAIGASFTLTVASEPVETTQSPYPGPDAPVIDEAVFKIAAVDYDAGANGEAYLDNAGLQSGSTDGGRAGSDVEITPGGAVGWVRNGEWLEYTVDVAEAGRYDLSLALATPNSNRGFQVDVFRIGSDGQEGSPYASTGQVGTPVTGSYASFRDTSAGALDLETGTQILRVTFSGNDQDFRDLTLKSAETPLDQSPYPGPEAPVIGTGVTTIAAADYDTGANGEAYSDNAGLQRGSTDGGRVGSDVEITPGGDVGWVRDGEWLEYTIDVSEAGLYQMSLDLATPNANRSFQVDVFDIDIDGGGQAETPYASTGPVATPVTGSYTAFQETSTDLLDLEEGLQIVRITFSGKDQDFREFDMFAV